MSDIPHLLRVAARRNQAADHTYLRLRLLKSHVDELREQLDADGVSISVLFDAVIRGYLGRHPAVLAMLDDRVRDAAREQKRVSSLNDSDVDDIYAALGGGTLDEED